MKKTTHKAILCLTACTLAFSHAATSQTLSSADIKEQLVKEWQRAKDYTLAYLNTMPADKYSFRAVDSIRSFAQQMIHLAQANYGLMAAATDKQPPAFSAANLEQSAGAQTKDSVVYYVTNSYDFCIQAVQNSDVAKWGEQKKFFGMDVTRFALLIKTFEHQTHHRGQTTVYIRLNGIKPPNEQLF